MRAGISMRMMMTRIMGITAMPMRIRTRMGTITNDG